ncbi:MAG: DoxX family protein [Muribaculaceae bacterium]|nr:DoxX family protein [Muribaculaceae bacterium]
MTNFFKNLFLYSVGHTYSNLSRLFLRLFTGIMFLQLCIRQMLNFDQIVPTFQGFLGMSPEASMTLLVVIELLCAVCIMLGLLTRLAVLFPLGLMLVAENVIMSSQNVVTDQLFNFQPGYPVMFIGIFIFMLLAGPGKISLDYFIAAHFTENSTEEEVLDKA